MQVAWWGHPITTASMAIDYFFGLDVEVRIGHSEQILFYVDNGGGIGSLRRRYVIHVMLWIISVFFCLICLRADHVLVD